MGWNPPCISSSTGKVDIYLFSPTSNQSCVHIWQGVPNDPGSYSTQLEPKWWQSSSSISLQFTIVDSGVPSFLATYSAGPFFTATYTAPANGKVPDSANTAQPDNGITNVGALANHKLSSGKVAAAVLMPLLLLIGLAVAYWIKMSR